MTRKQTKIDRPVTQLVDQISRLPDYGLTIPLQWFQHLVIRLNRDGDDQATKPDTLAMMVLANIVWWYRAEPIRDEDTQYLIGHRRRFAGEKLNLNEKHLAKFFGMTERQAKEALYRLEMQYKVIKRSFRIGRNAKGEIVKGGTFMYVEPIPERLFEITITDYTVPDDLADQDSNEAPEDAEQPQENPDQEQENNNNQLRDGNPSRSENNKNNSLRDGNPSRSSSPPRDGNPSRSTIYIQYSDPSFTRGGDQENNSPPHTDTPQNISPKRGRGRPRKNTTPPQGPPAPPQPEQSNANPAQKYAAASPHLDPAKFDQYGLIPIGQGVNAAEVFHEFIEITKCQLILHQQRTLIKCCPDLDRLRQVMNEHANRGHNLLNTAKIVEWYADPDRMRANAPEQKKPPTKAGKQAQPTRSTTNVTDFNDTIIG